MQYIVILLHFTQNMHQKKSTLEFRTSNENKENRTKKTNKSETEPISARSVVQVMMTKL
jgi:hypothetical protein